MIRTHGQQQRPRFDLQAQAARQTVGNADWARLERLSCWWSSPHFQTDSAAAFPVFFSRCLK
jgi:hypothetical protein